VTRVESLCIDRTTTHAYSLSVRVRVGDVRLYFDVEGSGLVVDGPSMRERPTLVLLSGGPGFDHSVFKPSYAQLADVAQLVYLDFQGHGRSDHGDPARWTVNVLADDIRGFCDAIGIDHPAVLGWSFGGMVAMAYAARHPGHPAKLILQSTMARLDIDRVAEGFRRVGGDKAAEVARTLWSGGGPDALAAYVQTCSPLYSPSRADPDASARAIFNLELLSDPGSVMRGMDLLPELASITCPTLVVVGDADPICTVDAATDIVAALPDHLVRFERFPDAGHHIHRDNPDPLLPRATRLSRLGTTATEDCSAVSLGFGRRVPEQACGEPGSGGLRLLLAADRGVSRGQVEPPR
jgi:pimeloyl-ACP methyl ester carboxylesterase